MADAELEIRELRRRKILQNATNRMNRILKTQSSEGNDLTANGSQPLPLLDDSNLRSNVTNNVPVSTQDNSTSIAFSTPKIAPILNGHHQRPVSSVEPTVSTPASPTLAEIYRHKQRWYQKWRFWISTFLGFALRLSLQMPSFLPIPVEYQSIFAFWFVAAIALETIHRFNPSTSNVPRRWPAHGHVVDFLLSFAFPQRLVVTLGKWAEVLTRLLDDFVAYLLTFLLTHFLLLLVGVQADFGYHGNGTAAKVDSEF